MLENSKVELNKIMNRLRARFYSNIESLGLDKEREEAEKKFIRDCTSLAWNDLTKLLENVTKERE